MPFLFRPIPLSPSIWQNTVPSVLYVDYIYDIPFHPLFRYKRCVAPQSFNLGPVLSTLKSRNVKGNYDRASYDKKILNC